MNGRVRKLDVREAIAQALREHVKSYEPAEI
jgi:hypothetical protein